MATTVVEIYRGEVIWFTDREHVEDLSGRKVRVKADRYYTLLNARSLVQNVDKQVIRRIIESQRQ